MKENIILIHCKDYINWRLIHDQMNLQDTHRGFSVTVGSFNHFYSKHSHKMIISASNIWTDKDEQN